MGVALAPGGYSGLICRSLAALFRDELGSEPDDALLSAMVADCSARALESTGQAAIEEEILHFAKAKVRVLSRASNIRNHAAVMRKALPECFSGEAFRAFRAAAGKQFSFDFDNTGLEAAEKRHSLWTDISARHRTGNLFDMQGIAEDPDLDEQGRAQARELWRRFGRLQEFGL